MRTTLPIKAAGAALIVIIPFLAYFSSLSGNFIFDDDLFLTDNPLVKSSDGLYQFWGAIVLQLHPVSNGTLWIEWRLWGMNPTGYHITNLLLHIAESLLFWIILRKMSIPGAFLGALIFAVHPVNVESVAWIAQRKNLMAMLFLLLSILWYLKSDILSSVALRSLSQPADAGRSPIGYRLLFYCLSLAAFILAMFSKGSVAILPLLLLAIIWLYRPLTTGDLARIAPFLLISLVLTVINVHYQTNPEGAAWRATYTERLLGAGGVVWFYLYKALLPLNLIIVYPQWYIQTDDILWWLPLLAAAIMTGILWRYREGWSRPFFVVWCFFCVSLVPMLGFVDVGFMQFSLVADHYQHIAIIGVITLAAAGWGIWRRQARGIALWATTVMAIAIIGILAFLTWQQSRLYRNATTLYETTLEYNPDCVLAHNNLAAILTEAGRLPEAIRHCEQALRAKADDPNAYNNLGVALNKAGRPQEAIEIFRRLLQLKKNFPEAYFNLGNVFKKIGQYPQAIDCYQKALQLKADYLNAYNSLGMTLYEINQPQEAIGYYQRALEVDPDHFQTHFNLGNALKAMGRYQQAIEQYQKTLSLKPDYIEALNNLGVALFHTKRPREAIEQYRKVLRQNPDLAEAYYNLALAYAELHESTAAIAAAEKAIDLLRAKDQTASIKQIEDWLSAYRESLSQPASNAPAP